MRPALLLAATLLATLAAAAVACGGSSSETPWPVEPAPSVMDPATDLAPVADDDAGARRRKE